MRHDARKVIFDVVKVRGNEMLFSDERIDRCSIPKGWGFYEVRHADEQYSPAEIADSIFVNFYGTLLAPNPIKNWDEENPNRIFLNFKEEPSLYDGPDGLTDDKFDKEGYPNNPIFDLEDGEWEHVNTTYYQNLTEEEVLSGNLPFGEEGITIDEYLYKEAKNGRICN